MLLETCLLLSCAFGQKHKYLSVKQLGPARLAFGDPDSSVLTFNEQSIWCCNNVQSNRNTVALFPIGRADVRIYINQSHGDIYLAFERKTSLKVEKVWKVKLSPSKVGKKVRVVGSLSNYLLSLGFIVPDNSSKLIRAFSQARQPFAYYEFAPLQGSVTSRFLDVNGILIINADTDEDVQWLQRSRMFPDTDFNYRITESERAIIQSSN
ncbi:hypothetical protein BH11ARM1_BH11ARM1_13790 [soil metagenome]